MTKPKYLALILFVSGCVSVGNLPERASEIDFAEAVDNFTGWRTYEKSHVFEDTDRELVYNAAKAALLHADYEITTARLEDNVVMAKDQIFAVCGVYLNRFEDDTQIRIIVMAPWDITAPVPALFLTREAKKILDFMRLYVESESRTASDKDGK